MSATPTTAEALRPSSGVVVWTLCQRELVRFFRQRNRVFGALGQPVIFWLLFSEGLQPTGLDYRHFFPGTLVMILLFTAIFATISIIEDRREGFLQSVLVAPIPRWAMVLGKILGGTLLAVIQGLLFLVLGLLTLDLGLGVVQFTEAVLMMLLISFALTALGFLIAWRMDSTQGFHAIMSIFLLPMWLLSGAFFPAESGVLAWLMWLNPLTYGVAGLRLLLQLTPEMAPALPAPPTVASQLTWCWLITLLFALILFVLACKTAGRRTTGDLL